MSVTNDGAPSYIHTGWEYGVFSLDPRWDGPLRSLEVEFELSAYGGGGADGNCEGASSFVTDMHCAYRDSAYKQEWEA